MAGGFQEILKDASDRNRERSKFFDEKIEELLTAASKGVGLLNSAGTAAMLAFMQALIAKGDALMMFKPFGIAAVISYLCGAFIATLVFGFRVWGLQALRERKANAHWPLITQLLLGTGMLAFAFGSVIAVIGIHLAL